MNRLITVVVTAVVLVGTAGAVPAALAQSTPQPPPTASPPADGNTTIAPGERLAGVVGVGRAEVAGEVSARAFGFAVASARTNRSRAALVGQQVGDLDRELATLRERQRELQRAHANGSISDGRYRAEMAQTVARVRAVERLTNRTENASQGLPAELLRRNGVNATAIHRLRINAHRLTGPEVAAIARSIAGPRAGGPMARGPPNATMGPPSAPGVGPDGNVTVPGRPGNATHRGPPGGQDAGPGPDNGNGNRPGPAGNQSAGPNRGQRGP